MDGPIGIFGGAFDPVHFGHLRLALEFVETLDLARVHLVPTGTPVHRRPPGASGRQRIEMLRRAVAGTRALTVDSRELERTGPSYMVDTLTNFRRDNPGRALCLLLGMDQFVTLDAWYRWTELFELVHIAVAKRPHVDIPRHGPVAAVLRERKASQASALAATPAGRIVMVDAPALEISSTRVRTLLEQGRNARYLIPDIVLEFIQHEGLYTHGK